MNLIIIPFHDWRKSEKEGFRTRDVHLIKAFEQNSQVKKLLIVNRPTTIFELKLKKYGRKLTGEIVYENGNFTMTKVSDKIFVLDFISFNFFGQLFLKHKWFINNYGNKKLINCIEHIKRKFNFNEAICINQNIFAYRLFVKIKSREKLFDAWDNFLKFPAYAYLKDELETGYALTSKKVKTWITNSKENQIYYKNTFEVKNIHVIKNGVNIDFSNNCSTIPADMKKIPKPIIGFGGKISYLLDVKLINFLVEDNPNLSFVFVGQILDKEVFKEIIKHENIYFLGDKNYTVYPCYVNCFDVGFIPYKIAEQQHGGDSIKAYEYLQAGKKVIGTRGNGLQDLEDYLYIANNKEEFSGLLKSTLQPKLPFYTKDFSWQSKADQIISIINK